MSGVIEMIFLGTVVIIGFIFLMVILHYSGKRGEECCGYPYNCPVCRHAAECIIEIGRKKNDA